MAVVQSLLALRSSCDYCAARPLGLCGALGHGEAFGELRDARRAMRFVDAGEAVYRQGEPCGDALNLVTGWLALHQDLGDGRRMVLRFLVPGAIVGHQTASLPTMTHGATALTNASLCVLPAARLAYLRARHSDLNERYLWMLERDSLLTTDHLIAIGRRDARERVAGLLMELAVRSTGRARFAAGDTVAMPLTQVLIGEATGLTAVHVNRTLRGLREAGVLDFRDRQLEILDPDRSAAIADLGEDLLRLWARQDQPAQTARSARDG